jgi:uncharacterized protein YybS (DUF2232 family)
VTRKAIIGMIRAAALAAACFLAGGAIPIAGGVAMLFAPAPILIYAVGRPNPNLRSIVGVIIAGTLVTLGAGVLAGASYIATFGLATGVMSFMLERRHPFERIVVVSAAAMLLAGTVAALVVTGSPDALVRAMRDQLQAGMAHGQQLYKLMGMRNTIPGDTQASIVALTMRLSPALAAIIVACSALLNLRIFWRWVGPQRLAYGLFSDLSRWSTPEWLVWVLLASGFGMFIPLAPVSDIALNGFICVAAAYFCQGLAIMGFYFQTLAVPSVVRGVIYFVTFAQPAVAAIVCAAGIFDMWIDFRRLKPPSREAGSFGDFL